MSTPRTYSKIDAQQRTIVSLFSIMRAQSPTAAEALLVKLQALLRTPKEYRR